MQYDERFSHPMGLWKVEPGSVFPGVYVIMFIYANTSIWPYSVHRNRHRLSLVSKTQLAIHRSEICCHTFQKSVPKLIVGAFHIFFRLASPTSSKVENLHLSPPNVSSFYFPFFSLLTSQEAWEVAFIGPKWTIPDVANLSLFLSVGSFSLRLKDSFYDVGSHLYQMVLPFCRLSFRFFVREKN